jgi:hypothetical protein
VNAYPWTSDFGKNQQRDLCLTGAVRPASHLPVTLSEGYRQEVYRPSSQGMQVPLLVASVSCERLFDVFVDLLEPLGSVVDIVLETSHYSSGPIHQDLFRESMDLPVLLSYLYEFEDLLLNDGCTGIAVLSATEPMEVQFDEHKLLVVYAQELAPFQGILEEQGIARKQDLQLITEGEHLHRTDPEYVKGFQKLCAHLGVGQEGERVNWPGGEEERDW